MSRFLSAPSALLVALAVAGAAAAAAPAALAQRDTAQAGPVGRDVTIRLRDLQQLDAISRRLEDFGPEIADAVEASSMRVGGATVPAGRKVQGDLIVYRGDADVYGEVEGHVVALFGNVLVHRGATITGSAVALDGQVRDEGGTVGGEMKSVSAAELDSDLRARAGRAARPPAARARSAVERVSSGAVNVVAVFLALAMLGFGTVFFGRRQLEVVSDTATHSFGRALVAGLLGQLLLVPTFAMLVVGLVLTVVGILLLPFAAVAYAVLAVLAAVGGYLAVAHAVGETFTRRRMAHGAFVRAPNSYGYLFTGLVGLLGLWALAALTGWLGPLAILFNVAAALVTWIAATVGFGAVLLSRGGLRETFTGRQMGEATDEYLWATPPATPAAGSRQPPG